MLPFRRSLANLGPRTFSRLDRENSSQRTFEMNELNTFFHRKILLNTSTQGSFWSDQIKILLNSDLFPEKDCCDFWKWLPFRDSCREGGCIIGFLKVSLNSRKTNFLVSSVLPLIRIFKIKMDCERNMFCYFQSDNPDEEWLPSFPNSKIFEVVGLVRKQKSADCPIWLKIVWNRDYRFAKL